MFQFFSFLECIILNEFLLRIRIVTIKNILFPLLYKDVFESILFTVAFPSIDGHCSRNKRRRSRNLFTIYAKCNVGTTSTTNWLSIRRRYGNVLLLYELYVTVYVETVICNRRNRRRPHCMQYAHSYPKFHAE